MRDGNNNEDKKFDVDNEVVSLPMRDGNFFTAVTKKQGRRGC